MGGEHTRPAPAISSRTHRNELHRRARARVCFIPRGRKRRATIKDELMTIANRMRSFLSRWVGALRAAQPSEQGRATSAANPTVAESQRDTVPIRFSLRLPLQRRAAPGNRDAP
jgi:hypothetical protein